MKSRSIVGFIGAGLLFATMAVAAEGQKPETKPASSDMQGAIAWEKFKDAAAARQARLEAKHPSVTYSNADRADRAAEEANQVKDPGPPKTKK